MTEEGLAHRRIRVLRRDQYACQWRNRKGSPVCGTPASHVGSTLFSDDLVALCLRHAITS